MARDKAEKAWIAGGAGAAVLVAAGAWMFAVSPALGTADSIRSATADVTTQNFVLQSNVAKLQQQYEHIDKMRQAEAIARRALPGDLALSDFTDQINQEAQAYHLDVNSMTAADPVPAAPAPVATPAATASPSPTPSPTTTTSAATASGLFAIPITLVVSGSQADELGFVHAVQRDGARAALVTSTTISADTSGKGGMSMSIELQVFVALSAPPSTAAASAPVATPTTSSTP